MQLSTVQQTEPATPDAVSCQLILGELPSRATTSPERGPTAVRRTISGTTCLAAGAVAVYSLSVQATLSGSGREYLAVLWLQAVSPINRLALCAVARACKPVL